MREAHSSRLLRSKEKVFREKNTENWILWEHCSGKSLKDEYRGSNNVGEGVEAFGKAELSGCP
jgi:hypothetical protein